MAFESSEGIHETSPVNCQEFKFALQNMCMFPFQYFY